MPAADRPGHGIGPGQPDLLALGGLCRGRAAIPGLPGAAAGLNVDLDEGVRRPPGNDAPGHQRPQPGAGGIVQAARARQSERVLQYAGGPAGVRVVHRSFPDRRQSQPVARMRFSLDLRGGKDLNSGCKFFGMSALVSGGPSVPQGVKR